MSNTPSVVGGYIYIYIFIDIFIDAHPPPQLHSSMCYHCTTTHIQAFEPGAKKSLHGKIPKRSQQRQKWKEMCVPFVFCLVCAGFHRSTHVQFMLFVWLQPGISTCVENKYLLAPWLICGICTHNSHRKRKHCLQNIVGLLPHQAHLAPRRNRSIFGTYGVPIRGTLGTPYVQPQGGVPYMYTHTQYDTFVAKRTSAAGARNLHHHYFRTRG